MRKRLLLLFPVFLFGCEEAVQTEIDSQAAAADEALLQASMQSTPFIHPGLKLPTTFAADEVELPQNQQIIGVTVGDESRAYVVNDLSRMTTHVVNDLIGKWPISVTYCNRTDIVRVFADANGETAMELGVGGWQGDEMLITVEGNYFKQEAEDIPVSDFPFERTTWGEWKRLHPETRVFTLTKK
jgi:hypothetical protein